METDVLILGAGIAGLTAGRFLKTQGRQVLLLDKGRGVGGRLATRWKGSRDHIDGRWDHGAQFVTFRSEGLKHLLKDWEAWEVLDPWIPSHSDPDLMRYRPLEGMNAFAKQIASSLEIRRSQRAVRISKDGARWVVETESGDTFQATQLISTIPIPQFLDLEASSPVELLPEEQQTLSGVHYEKCLSLLTETSGEITLPSDGYVRLDTGVLETIIHHRQKGISKLSTLTAHATSSFSREWYDRDRATAASVLRAAVQEQVNVSLDSVQIHGWKFAKAVQRIPAASLQLTNGIHLAGDGFKAGDDKVSADLHPRIESAMLSGLDAAKSLLF